jgi:7,8-dihydropterin-6-yl-methyl-4-(beta-D-ribofuranosyl)aminobenzene 5'-phosphate synthase
MRTGEPAFAILQKFFGDHYLYAGLGSTLIVGPKVMAQDNSGAPAFARAMNDKERQIYRQLAARLAEEQPLLAAADPRTDF